MPQYRLSESAAQPLSASASFFLETLYAHASNFRLGRSGDTAHSVEAEVRRKGVPPAPLPVAIIVTTALVLSHRAKLAHQRSLDVGTDAHHHCCRSTHCHRRHRWTRRDGSGLIKGLQLVGGVVVE